MSQLRAPAFFQGAASVFGAFRFLTSEPGLWPMALVPTLLFFLIGGISTYAGAHWIAPEALSLLDLTQPESWYAAAGQWVVNALTFLLSAFLGVLTAFLVTPPLSAPALEHLVSEQETSLGVEPRKGVSFIREVWCGIQAQAFAVAFATPLWLGLWLVGWLLPPATLLTLPLQVLVVSLALAWNLIDYPLTLRGVSASDRIGLVSNHLAAVVGFGLVFSALFWIPCFSIVMLPVGAVAATRLVWAILQASPTELPSLPRPAPAPALGTGPLDIDSRMRTDTGLEASPPPRRR